MKFSDPDERPYFLWSEAMTVGEFREALAQASDDEKAQLLGRLLREARDPDVWEFTTVEEVRRLFPRIDRYLGRRRDFWTYLLNAWAERGLAWHRAPLPTPARARTGVLPAPAIHTVQQFPKVTRDGVVTDSAAEIFVNKLGTLVERSEVRDLVDVLLLERSGLRVEDFLARAQQKDAGVTPATMAWLVKTLPIPASPPGGVSREAVEAYVVQLEDRLLRLTRSG